MNKDRTLSKLKEMGGKIYIWFANADVAAEFKKNATEEGYRFGDTKPIDIEDGLGIVCLKKNKQLTFVGFVGHIEFQCNGGVNSRLVRVDYEKYIRGDENFLFENPPFEPLTIKTKFFDKVTVVGDNAPQAVNEVLAKCYSCETEDDEVELHKEVEKKFKVAIFSDDEDDDE